MFSFLVVANFLLMIGIYVESTMSLPKEISKFLDEAFKFPEDLVQSNKYQNRGFIFSKEKSFRKRLFSYFGSRLQHRAMFPVVLENFISLFKLQVK